MLKNLRDFWGNKDSWTFQNHFGLMEGKMFDQGLMRNFCFLNQNLHTQNQACKGYVCIKDFVQKNWDSFECSKVYQRVFWEWFNFQVENETNVWSLWSHICFWVLRRITEMGCWSDYNLNYIIIVDFLLKVMI